MPYEEVDVPCGVICCENNNVKNKECTAHCDIHELEPDEADTCSYFHCDVKKVSQDYKTVDALLADLDDYDEMGISCGVVDNECLHLHAVQIVVGNKADKTFDQYGIVRCLEKDISDFKFFRTIDNNVGFTHRNQLELTLV
jgi:hypothetical protein